MSDHLEISASQARALVDGIKIGVEAIWDLANVRSTRSVISVLNGLRTDQDALLEAAS